MAEPRYEFRVWAPRLDEVSTRIRAVSASGGIRESTEIYLASRNVPHVNPKVRDGLLDIKVLLGMVHGFEQWEPRLKAAFPLDAGTLRDDVFPLLGQAAPPLDRRTFTLDHLVDEIVAPHPDLHATTVHKRRESFRVHGCIAEVARVTIDGRELETASIESPDPAALREATGIAGLDAYENTSYPSVIRGLIGWAAAPTPGEATPVWLAR